MNHYKEFLLKRFLISTIYVSPLPVVNTKYTQIVMGNSIYSKHNLDPLRESLKEPISYDTVMLFYNFVQDDQKAIPLGYLVLENELVDRFIELVSVSYYKTKDEIELISKMICKLKKISRTVYDPEENLNYIR